MVRRVLLGLALLSLTILVAACYSYSPTPAPPIASPTEVAPTATADVSVEPIKNQITTVNPKVSLEAMACLGCHKTQMAGITKDWQDSKHAASGVDCWSCHGATSKSERQDAFLHNGYRIVTLVTPQDCAACHSKEAAEFQASRHADAAVFIGSLDNILGEIIGGGPAADSGCRQCHGSDLSTAKDGVLQAAAWPNTGIGRLNPDGSKGTCTACHSRHVFSIAQARQPEICAKCHLGPDHPQMEIWQESKHGIRYNQAVLTGQNLNIDAAAGEWLPGRDYSAGPTCATCHQSATPNQPVTHDVGTRLSWTLRPAVSVKQENWEAKRADMQDVCTQCHSKSFSDSHYAQLDSLVTLYNDKFGAPAKAIVDGLTAQNKLTAQPFDNDLKWTYYELWHHEGRRARHGAAMSGADYAWWHGLYDVAQSFYTKFIPAARELDPQLVEATIGPMSEHDWYTKGLTKEQIQEILDFYNQRYGEK